MRAQSVSDGFFKFLSLMLQRLSQRDNPYCVRDTFREDHDDNSIAKKTDPRPTLFAIIFSRIKRRLNGSFKDFPSVGKVKAVFAEVLSVLFFIPFKVHAEKCSRKPPGKTRMCSPEAIGLCF